MPTGTPPANAGLFFPAQRAPRGRREGTDESAGKRGSGATARGNKWLRAALTEAARAAARTKGTCLATQYHLLVCGPDGVV